MKNTGMSTHVQSLYPVHRSLLDGFGKCVDQQLETDIAKYFIDQQQGLLAYGLYAAKLPVAVEKVSNFK